MDTKELILACCGGPEDGHPKTMTTLFNEIWLTDGTKINVDSIHIDKPELKIFKHDSYVQVDFIYEAEGDQDLYYQWKFLEDFAKPENSVAYSEEEMLIGTYITDEGEEKPIELPTLVVNIVPRKYNGRYFLFGTNPIFTCLQPLAPDEDGWVIRMVFEEDQFFFLEASEDELNIADIEKEVDAEINLEMGNNI